MTKKWPSGYSLFTSNLEHDQLKYVYVFILFRSLGTIIMAATADPRPVKLQQNVALKFKNLKVARKKLPLVWRKRVILPIKFIIITCTLLLRWYMYVL